MLLKVLIAPYLFFKAHREYNDRRGIPAFNGITALRPTAVKLSSQHKGVAGVSDHMRSARVTALACKPVRAPPGRIQPLSFTEVYSVTSRLNTSLASKPAPIPNLPSIKIPSRGLIPHPIRRLEKRLQQHLLFVFFQTEVLHRHQHAGQPLIAR